MRIVFVETPSPWLVRRNTHVPLGLLYLATVLKREGYDVKLARPEKLEDFENFSDADIICMSGTTLEYPMNVDCVKWIRNHFPHMKIFIGGPHVTAMYQDVLKNNLFDAIGVGEGEYMILDMVKDVECGRLKEIYFSNKFIKNLDTIPFPDRTLIEGDYGKGVFSYNEQYMGDKSESIMTARGCPNNCAFCASKSMWRCKIRYRSVENVSTEIEHIIDSTGTRQFAIWDDSLTANKKNCLELCSLLRELNIAWKCSARASSLSPDICEALVSAGCKEIAVGLESGDQRVLNFINKHATIEAMAQGCENANRAGLKIRGMFITGLPGEREDTPELTMDYIQRLDVNMIRLFLFTPLPGSPIWNNPEKYNCEILSKDFTKYNEYCYIMEHGEKTHLKYNPLIHNKYLTINQMKNNAERMRNFVEETGKYNEG